MSSTDRSLNEHALEKYLLAILETEIELLRLVERAFEGEPETIARIRRHVVDRIRILEGDRELLIRQHVPRGNGG